MTKVDSFSGYDFYIGHARLAGSLSISTVFNIVPTGSKNPEGGYKNRQYIENIKGVKFPDRYQPTLHGMRELYLSPDCAE